MVKTNKVEKWIKTLTARKEAIGKERDRLRNFAADIDDLREACESAYDDIESAIDKLSELV